MTNLQKANVLRTTRDEFKVRLNELSKVPLPQNRNDRMQILNRKDALSQAINFCSCLLTFLKRNKDFKPENNSMLEFIGLEDLY